MTRISLLVLAATLPFAASCTQPSGTYQDAQVRIVHSQACFSVNASDEARRTPPTIAGITVGKYTENGVVKMWQWRSLAEPPITLRPEDCIPYDYQGSGVADVKATGALRPGERYGVSINSHIPNPEARGDRWLNRSYGRDFCLTTKPDGRTEVILVTRRAGVLQWAVCPSASVSEGE